MNYIVDLQVRGSSLRVIKCMFREDVQISSLHSGSDSKQNSNKKLGEFLNLLKAVVKRKLESFPKDRLKTSIITGQELMREGQGSIEIKDPPTEAQQHLIRSLAKVLLHQFSSINGKVNTVNEGQDNLFLSLFVKKISIEQQSTSHVSIKLNFHEKINLGQHIDSILDSEETNESDTYHMGSADEFIIYPFCCLEEQGELKNGSILSTEFDKIDLELDEDDGFEGETLNNCINSVGNFDIPLSKQTLNLVNISYLPGTTFEGQWESLYFGNNIKERLYSYATISLKIARFKQTGDSNQEDITTLITNNKLLLVHGPPGTGKTTLCKALCQKLSVRREFSDGSDTIDTNYKGIIIELSCARIFSKWFGESSKNISIVFKDIEELLKVNEGRGIFICLLIDEVEAIASSRTNLSSRNESTDGIRVVNTLLTQLDRLKKYHNFLALATSNLLDSLDDAFVDRADGVFYVGNPTAEGILHILKVCIEEMITSGIILFHARSTGVKFFNKYQDILRKIAIKCSTVDISGRTIRKLPLMCLSEYFQTFPVDDDEFVLALAMSARKLSAARK
ncbi:CPS_HP_G0105330.mRNA.1.CDS.1 [Saccharomyces cerevisiae]|nr:CPS_HP_G0064050.mRNA.1.CDS.1 [Saccharomyces cerevisiae]CAI5031382.1 CPS_HP_G0102670.mRNA.1.CDS.1 [Saccharomyces cerevisiae]CAI5035895.1 CPS_HP_G0105330.mRNA.1.CDS.1 [Saccharomyces cerevisiae]CAI6842809.1 CPS_HP_G0064050.mRNA.1.CDS.1 [Saccharomyces cerevisiae]CAI6948898.1 CPS_HP_G0102670.mRNA.1.CDS.1 [Saccharomyces cerevisiae]